MSSKPKPIVAEGVEAKPAAGGAFEEPSPEGASDLFTVDPGEVGSVSDILGPVAPDGVAADEAQADRDPQPDVGGVINTPDAMPMTTVGNVSDGEGEKKPKQPKAKAKARATSQRNPITGAPMSKKTLLEQEAGRKALQRHRST